MSNTRAKENFQRIYAGQAPWDIPGPQPAYVAQADRVTGAILDAGCGSGELALYFAQRGHSVTAFDFVDEAIARAKEKAAQRGLTVNFLVKDALTLGAWDQRFNSIIDSGLLHVFSDEDRREYVDGLHHVLEPNGRLYLMCFGDAEPGTHGPRRLTKDEVLGSFARGWSVESIQPARYEVIPDVEEFKFSPGGAKAWFVVARKH